MKRLAAIILMLVILTSILATPIFAVGPSLYAAIGGGTMEQVYGSKEIYRNSYTLTVQQLDELGNAKGHFVSIFNHGSIYHHCKVEADLKYMDVVGNAVYMSGVITYHYRNPILIGKGIIFGAQDNGEGSLATGLDKVSVVCSGSPIDAAINEEYRNRSIGQPAYWFELTNGNIQIR